MAPQLENLFAGPNKPLRLHSTCDVAIVGYGPVGIVLSTLLAQSGLNVIVVERYPERFQLSRAGHLDGETMRMFQRLGCSDKIELIARPSLAYSMVTPDLEVLQTLTQPMDGSGWKPSYLTASFQIEKIIHAHALESGVQVYMGITAKNLEQDNERAVLTVYPSGQEEAAAHTITASYVIGADGAGSFVQKAAGITRLDRGFLPVDMLVIDFEHDDPDRDLPLLQSNYQVLDVNRPTTTGRWGANDGAAGRFLVLSTKLAQRSSKRTSLGEFLENGVSSLGMGRSFDGRFIPLRALSHRAGGTVAFS